LRVTVRRKSHVLGLVSLLAGLCFALACAGASVAVSRASTETAGAAVSPLPSSDYGVRMMCSAPAPKHAACLALQLVPKTFEARARTHPLGIARARRRASAAAPSPAAGNFGLRPQDLHSAYQLPTTAPSSQTVALVDAYNDPDAESDLKAYSEEFGLSECTAANGCFKQVNQNGETGNPPFPRTLSELEAARRGSRSQRAEAEEATGWGLEISLDIEVAHATCQSCDILLVEADTPSYENLEAAERSAADLGAGEISNSWSGSEAGETPELESASPFDHPGIVIAAASGDSGYLNWDARSSLERGSVGFPASSPHVVAVGGTRLTLGEHGEWSGEAVWNGDGATGGGCSTVFTAQPWQQALANWSAVGCASKRALADIAADADPYTGVAVRYTSPECEYAYTEAKTRHVLHWCTIGGTSLSTPLISAVYALAGGADGVSYPAQTLYENELASSTSLHDVTSGSNGECSKPFTETGLSGCTIAEEAASCESEAICLAGTNYDGPTGLGTPDGIAAFQQSSAPPPPPPPPPPSVSPPEFGRCVEVGKGAGKFASSACTRLGGSDSHEWQPGAVNPAFTTRSTSRSVTLEPVTGAKVVCTSEASAGEYSGSHTVGGVVLTLTGCERSGESCASGAVAGEIVSSPLEGVLGIEKLGATASKDKIGLELHPLGSTAPVVAFSCGLTAVSVTGAVIVPLAADKMTATQTLKFKATKGKQKPLRFVEGSEDVLEASVNGAAPVQLGLTMTSTVTSEEPVEIDAVV
jgi:Subtilase family